jgi:hypothetical protein
MTADLFKAVRPSGHDFRTGTLDYASALGTGRPIRHPNPNLNAADASGYLSAATVATDCTGMGWPCRLLRVQPVGPTLPPDLATLPNKVRCEALLVVEELPAHVALGPQGVEVAALIERAARLSPDEIRSLSAAYDAERVAALSAALSAAYDAERVAALSAERVAARDAARVAALSAERVAARDAARVAALSAERVAARDAARVAALSAAYDAERVAALSAERVAARDAARVAALSAERVAARDAARVAALSAARDAALSAARVAAALVLRDVLAPEHYQTLTQPWATAIGPCHPDDPPVARHG